MLPRLGIPSLLEAQLDQAVPGEARVFTSGLDQFAPQGDSAIRLARFLPCLGSFQEDLTTLLRIPDGILLKLHSPVPGGRRLRHGPSPYRRPLR
jgi:hypothetical protein